MRRFDRPFSWAKIVFSRYPRRGAVKTRLEPSLGAEGCLDFHRCLLSDTVERVASLPGPTYVYLDGRPEKPDWWLGSELDLPPAVFIRRQEGSDLGQRMWNACRKLKNQYDRLVLLGTDSPTVPLAYIEAACRPRKGRCYCVGPATDGGYYLLAFSRLHQEVFSAMPWGTNQVLQQTLERIPRQETVLLPRWFDVDRPADLQRLRRELRGGPIPGDPRRTRAFLGSGG